MKIKFLADPGKARGCSTHTSVIHSLIDYANNFQEILNPEGYLHHINGSQVTAIFVNEWILPNGEPSAVKGLRLQPAQQACLDIF